MQMHKKHKYSELAKAVGLTVTDGKHLTLTDGKRYVMVREHRMHQVMVDRFECAARVLKNDQRNANV